MTNVKQLREYLATLPDNLPVKVLKEYSGGFNAYTKWVDLELPKPEGSSYTESCDASCNDLELGAR